MRLIEGKDNILVLNAGSSSIKFAVFDTSLTEVLSGQVSGVGEQSILDINGQKRAQDIPDHATALRAILDAVQGYGITPQTLAAAAHRVVHGGAKLTASCRIDAPILNAIRAASPLAPLHNPHNLAGIKILADIAPELPQYASFDTAFHATNPKVANRYAIPEGWYVQGIRRYGFHGISYQSLVETFEAVTSAPLPNRLLAFHLGNGASICAIKNGSSVATTMGYSPLEGLTMGTRSGSIDAGAVLDMAAKIGIGETRDTLNHASGLAALSGGDSDMKTLCARTDEAARFAVDHFCYWAVRHAGSMIAALQGIDGIAFTGGIGENADDIRAKITAQMQWTGLSLDKIWIIPAQEERQIARNARELLYPNHG